MKKLLLKLSLIILSAVSSFGEPIWNFYSTTDFAYYTKSDAVTGDDHFAPITGAYNGVELQETISAELTVPASFSDNFLMKDSCIKTTGAMAVSPVSLKSSLAVRWNPVAFLELGTGAEIGTGWNAFGIKSLSVYDNTEMDYKMQDPFATWFYKWWACPVIMFDLGAVWPGEFHHVVAIAAWEFAYSGFINSESHDLFQWQSTPGKHQGWEYTDVYIIGYRMPFKLEMIGLKYMQNAYFNNTDSYKNFKGDYKTHSIAALGQYNFSKKDSLFLLAEFETRRSFSQYHEKAEEEPLLDCTGHEWYFKRVGFSYNHKF